ncbi:MAG: aminotransferase class V-fold PLP-dependent enzyme [Magnetococcales bacterium]|nr:aminotransferase class V-fold PLP-dependent enzyme [Magnetococcales bacterium]
MIDTDALPPRPATFGRALRPWWLLDEAITFLNHGSFGACPRWVLARQQAIRETMERQPVHFLTRELPGALREVADRLGRFLGTTGERIVLVDNATSGVNAVLRQMPLRAGEEILLSRFAYPMVKNAARVVCQANGALLVEARDPLPVGEASATVEAFAAAITGRTRLVILDHVGSPLPVVTPVREIAALCRSRGIAVLVDGAHAPGSVAIDLEELGVDWYTGNAHKWLCAPKGSAFLWMNGQAPFVPKPLVVSVHEGQGYHAEFGWMGTRDPSAWLAIGAALDFLGHLGWQEVWSWQRELVRRGAGMLQEAWGVEPLADEGRWRSMATVALPAGAQENSLAAIHDRLLEEYRVEVPVVELDGVKCVRISGQVYNDLEDVTRLLIAVKKDYMK